MRTRRGSGVVLAMAAALLAGGCTGSPAPAPAEPEVLVEIVQLRGDVASGHVELRVTNRSDAALTVMRATYESSRWSAPMVREGEAEIPPGLRRNLRLQLPEPTCDVAPIEHLATLELSDGTSIEQQPADPLEQLERLDDAECDLQLFEQEVAAVTWLEPRIPAGGDGPAVVRLEFEPVAAEGEQSATVWAVAATVLLTPVDASGTRIEALPVDLELRQGQPPMVVEVTLEPGRCDLHAIAEDKQGTIFRVHVSMGGEPIDLVLPSPDAQRDALLDWVVERCAAQP